MSAETEIATEHLRTVTHELDVAWPQMNDWYNRPFMPTKVEVRDYRNQTLGTYASVQGPAIRKDGTEGRSTRYANFQLDGRADAYSPEAPPWMIDALRGAGVTW